MIEKSFHSKRHTPIRLLSAFFAFGAIMPLLAAVTLLFPASGLNQIWRINPEGHEAFLKMGSRSFLILIPVATLCAATSIGLWLKRIWAYWLCIAMLSANLVGDVANVLLRRDYRAAIGVPIALALILYMFRVQTRKYFEAGNPIPPPRE